ncbi:MAG: endopeptidase La [Syntrophaceae bacterium CG2_30_49_12]|nr:MAG: endopeptidase La [Syntrophaceae bacterium CG2_30_49_12]PIP05767.1 MAG: endopeptidase La [Syntrophobacterales bacterium CG23_combo_of_CG06-09_8_20_14_all_48_27]PJC75795.1 MAG: endopeptidase La [Syntrophobacterales bacterium CG_4_8_14_3_um_filter_49_14]
MSEEKPSEELKAVNIPKILPLLPIFNIVVFPKMMVPLEVSGDQSTTLIDEAMAKDRLVCLVMAKKPPLETRHQPEDFYDIGTAVVILKMAKGADNKAQLLLQGIGRFKIVEFVEGKPYLQAQVEAIEDQEVKDIETEALMTNLLGLFDRVVQLSPFLPQEFGLMAKSITEPSTLTDMVASIINSTIEEKQKILETLDVKQRLQEVTRLINHQLEILELSNKIQSQVKNDIDKSQREYYLRQQLKAIRQELGETEESKVEVEEFRTKIEKKNLPEAAKKEAERELDRLSRMHPSSAEYTVAATYLDWLTALPWNEYTQDNLDIKAARQVLDEDHFGLEKPKKRVIEYLAVRKLKPDMKGPILCFVGPPGTGKTSLGHSIARALGRKFIRLSLGGVRDEAEIRGHRRTYVGALPGRIIQGIRRAESNNPLFMLDEIDKVGSDFRGDPSSALLEVLDPEQNFSFEDHYLDVPFDLSHVMFITTANIMDTVPPPLRDRMEVIELPGYTRDEKMKIAERYLIPRQIAGNGLASDQITFTKGAVEHIISGYTREAGVRNLEREIAAVCRGVASKVAEGKIKAASIGVKDIHRYLGPIRIPPDVSARISKPGVAMGLAWTPTGGELLFIEATSMKGKKGLTLTGQLGDVMKESANAALSFIRANAVDLGIPKDFFEEIDIHVHVPAGAIQKDGPSAGVTMLTALVSLLTNRKVKKDLVMTGEITLRGLVLPVGGIKEKVLAAHRAGVKKIILPRWNRKDLEDIPQKVQKNICFYFVDEMIEVLKLALEK